MAVVTVKSTIIANRDASPVVLTDPNISGGKFQEGMGRATVTNGDSIGSKYLLTQVPSNARISSLNLFCDAITGAAANIGVYNPTNKDGSAGSVVSVSLFAAAQSIATAIQNGSNVINQSTTNSLANQEKPLWQAAGLSADPGGMLDIVATLTAAATATGDLSIRAGYLS